MNEMVDADPRFLFSKYTSVHSLSELRRNERAATKVGFNCLKSIKWKALHISEDDPKHLKKFGDSLINGGKLIEDLYPQLTKLLLKRSCYNKNTQGFDREPKIRDSWKAVEHAFSVASSSSKYVHKRLCELSEGNTHLNEGLSDLSWCANIGQRFYYLSSLHAVMKSAIDGNAFDDCLHLKSHGDITKDSCLEAYSNEIYSVLADENIDIGDISSTDELITRLCDCLGLAQIKYHKSIDPVDPREEDLHVNSIIVSKLDPGKFFAVRYSKGDTVILLNEDHPFFDDHDPQEWLKAGGEVFSCSLMKALDTANIQDDQLDSVISYLGQYLRTFIHQKKQ